MTQPNQFMDPNAQFTQQVPGTSPGIVLPQAAPAAAAPFQAPPAAPAAPQGFQAPQAYQAPTAPAAPQGFQAPPAAPQGYQAPVAPQGFQQAPAPAVPHVQVPAHALSPSEVGADAFGQSAANTGVKMKDFLGQPLLFRIIEPYTWTNTQGNQVQAIRADFVVLDPTNPQVFTGVGISNAPIVRDLSNTLNNGKRYHVGRVMEVQSKHPQPALALGPLTPEETNFAVQVCQANGWV